MKTKEQKRREAIERLERPLRVDRHYAHNREWADKIESRRRVEAQRLRDVFGLPGGNILARR